MKTPSTLLAASALALALFATAGTAQARSHQGVSAKAGTHSVQTQAADKPAKNAAKKAGKKHKKAGKKAAKKAA